MELYKKIRWGIAIGIVLCSAVVLFSIKLSSFIGRSSAQKTPPIELLYYYDLHGETPLEGFLAQFTKKTGLRVDSHAIAGDYDQVLQQRYASNNSPDMHLIGSHLLDNFADRAWLLPLDGKLRPGYKTGILPELLDVFRYEGNLYGIPRDFATLALYYNTEIFDAAGLEYPKDNWTWYDLKNTSQKLMYFFQKEGRAEHYAIALHDELPYFKPLQLSAGAQMLENDKIVVNSAAHEKGLELWQNTFKKGYAIDPRDLGELWNGQTFASGKVAMAIEANWLSAYLQENFPDMAYGVVELPVKKKGSPKANVLFSRAWSISAQSKQNNDALVLLEWLGEYEVEQAILKHHSVGEIPARKNLIKTFRHSYSYSRVFIDALEYAHPVKYGVFSPVVITELGAVASRLRRNPELAIAEELSYAQAVIDSLQEREDS